VLRFAFAHAGRHANDYVQRPDAVHFDGLHIDMRSAQIHGSRRLSNRGESLVERAAWRAEV
jgi:hypothetical protein